MSLKSLRVIRGPWGEGVSGLLGAPHYARAFKESCGGQMGGEEPQQKEGRVREVGQDWRRCGLCQVRIKQESAEPPQKICSSHHGAISEVPASSPPPPLLPHVCTWSCCSGAGFTGVSLQKLGAGAVEAQRRGERARSVRGPGKALAGEPGCGGGEARLAAAAAAPTLLPQVALADPPVPGETVVQLRAPLLPLLSGAAELRQRQRNTRPPDRR